MMPLGGLPGLRAQCTDFFARIQLNGGDGLFTVGSGDGVFHDGDGHLRGDTPEPAKDQSREAPMVFRTNPVGEVVLRDGRVLFNQAYGSVHGRPRWQRDVANDMPEIV